MHEVALRSSDALIVVDVQKDFLPGGSLAVPGGNVVIPVINKYIERFEVTGLPVHYTRCWHPRDHCSFQAQGGPWPAHCIQEQAGAAFADGLRAPAPDQVVSKATTAEYEALSGFEGTNLSERLRVLGVRRVFVCGLAEDVCVLGTVRDALEAAFEVVLLEDATRPVDAESGEQARRRMREAGAQACTLDAVVT